MFLQVTALKDEKVTCVACGSGDAQTLCTVASGSVYSWGDGDYGKLGRGGNEGMYDYVDCLRLPHRVQLLYSNRTVIVFVVMQHSLTNTTS